MTTIGTTSRFVPFALAVLVGAAGVGCDKNDSSATDNRRDVAPPAADNTARNKADRDPGTRTPMDQGQGSADVKITAEIRRAIMGDKGMSINAQNCKIITEKGMVTLRGPVDSQAEKDFIDAKARAVAGVVSVENQLEVKIK